VYSIQWFSLSSPLPHEAPLIAEPRSTHLRQCKDKRFFHLPTTPGCSLEEPSRLSADYSSSVRSLSPFPTRAVYVDGVLWYAFSLTPFPSNAHFLTPPPADHLTLTMHTAVNTVRFLLIFRGVPNCHPRSCAFPKAVICEGMQPTHQGTLSIPRSCSCPNLLFSFFSGWFAGPMPFSLTPPFDRVIFLFPPQKRVSQA